jgi:TRAP-type C4-dicarboxylate transport system permease small subunit
VCILIDLLSLFFLFVMTHQGFRLTLLANATTPILNLPKRITYVDIPIAGAIMILYCIRDIVRHILSVRQAVRASR